MASQSARQIKAIIGDNVRRHRLSRGLTQSALAREIGVESMAVSRWERGAVRPSDANLQALSQVLGLGYGEFFEDLERAA